MCNLHIPKKAARFNSVPGHHIFKALTPIVPYLSVRSQSAFAEGENVDHGK
jgi:hypothetical protein